MDRMRGFAESGRKIVAVARNFVSHAKELNNPVPSAPVVFLKPTTSYLLQGRGAIEVPLECDEIHHEVELGVIIGRKGRDIPEISALDHVAGYVVALDMTARSLQNDAKKSGLPWTVSKGFDTFTPVSEFLPKERIPNPQNVELWCEVNGKERQRGNTRDMIFSISSLIAHISRIMTLEPADCILTGTPDGVGPVRPGDTIRAGITGLAEMQFAVVRRRSAVSNL